MPNKVFDKKNENVENNEQTVALASKPRIDFMDDEYKKIQPFLEKVLNVVEKLNVYYDKSIHELLTEIQSNIKDFELLYDKLTNYQIHVLRTGSFDTLGIRLINYYAWINMTKHDLSNNDYSESRKKRLLDSMIENFANLDLVVKNAIVSKKESVIFACNQQLNPEKKTCIIS